MLTCTSSVSSQVIFQWTHNGTNIRRAHSSITYGSTNTLTISNVRYSDGGSYVCIVKRRSLSVTSNTASITVYGMCVIIKCIILKCVVLVPKPVINNHPNS